MKNFLILTVALLGFKLYAQNELQGRVLSKDGSETIPLIGANVLWLNTEIGTITDEDGKFSIPFIGSEEKLILSYIGYKPDTLSIKENKLVIRFLKKSDSESLNEVTVTKRRKAIQKSYLEAQNIINVNSAELLKAACCNLSESFETNPSIDVNFSDALTGTKQIRMLGLESPYLLISEENIPTVRGASQAYGLSFTPGTWIESIQITKGTGSVINGYESIGGQINSEIKKPFSDVPLFINLFTSNMGRQEANIQGNWKISDKWSSGLFIHGNQRIREMDDNGDSFLDAPLSEQVNILNRWQYTDTNKGWVGFGSIRFMRDEKILGSLGFNPEEDRNKLNLWGSQIDSNRIDTSLKIGYVFPELSYKSFGFQSAFSNHDQEAYYGFRNYNINHQSFYSSLLYNSIIGNTKNKFKIGISFSYDRYLETVDTFYFNRSDLSVGSFLEYTYDSLENFSLVAGIRLDSHNRLGTFITPRLNLRYLPKENIILRLSAGTGRKAANIFAENQSLFGTNRQINIIDNGGSIYGLNPEKAWNYGLSIRHIFNVFGKSGDLTIDYYVTSFLDQVVIDWETQAQISFYNLNGPSRANSFQISLDYNPSEFLNLRFAYKNYDVKTTYNSGFLQRPLQAQNRFFANLGWESRPNDKQSKWRWDLTLHTLGKQRLVSTIRDLEGSYAPAYGLWNSQLTHAFSSTFEIYVGAENMGNYKQLNPIIGIDNPFGINFDTSQIYAPIFGRMAYIGLRWNL